MFVATPTCPCRLLKWQQMLFVVVVPEVVFNLSGPGMFTSHVSACSSVDAAASSHSHLPSFISNHLPSHQIVFPYPTSLKPRWAKRTNRAYFYSLNVWPRCSRRLCNCSAALACLDSWKPCDWSGEQPTLAQTWTLAGGAQRYFHMCGRRSACGGDGALNSRTCVQLLDVTCFKTFIRWWCIQAQEGSEGALMSSIPALWFEVLHRSVGLVGHQDGDLLTIRSFGSGDDFILWGHKKISE